MKRLREYHIESYWAEQALKRQKKAEIKERAFQIIGIAVGIALEFWLVYEFLDQLFEVI